MSYSLITLTLFQRLKMRARSDWCSHYRKTKPPLLHGLRGADILLQIDIRTVAIVYSFQGWLLKWLRKRPPAWYNIPTSLFSRTKNIVMPHKQKWLVPCVTRSPQAYEREIIIGGHDEALRRISRAQ